MRSSRVSYVWSSLEDSARAAGLARVEEPTADVRSVAFATKIPFVEAVKYGYVLFPSDLAAVSSGCPPLSFFPPIDPRVIEVSEAKAVWLDPSPRDYRVYSVVLPNELPHLATLVSIYLREFRATDAVSLTLRSLGDRAQTVAAVEAARASSNVPLASQARVRIHCGAWSFEEQAALAKWGDCCLLPWTQPDFPIEAGFALASGNFVAVSDLCLSPVSPGVCTILETVAGRQGRVPDWDQASAILRVAVANGRKVRFPAVAAAKNNFSSNPQFFRGIMAKLGLVSDFFQEGGKSACTLSLSLALNFAAENFSEDYRLFLKPQK